MKRTRFIYMKNMSAKGVAPVNLICQTRYPILLVHGLNYRDDRRHPYWGRIPYVLQKCGADVYLGNQDALGSLESNAAQIQKAVLFILKQHHCEKVNIIAHSKGGIEVRYMIDKLGMGPHVASLTTIATPHKGSHTASALLNKKGLLGFLSHLLNRHWRIFGDVFPDLRSALRGLVPEALSSLNVIEIKNHTLDNIYCQSFGARIGNTGKDALMHLTSRIFSKYDSENDGFVSPASARWQNYRGTIKNISHRDLVDSRRRNYKNFNVLKFYIHIAADLKKRGL